MPQREKEWREQDSLRAAALKNRRDERDVDRSRDARPRSRSPTRATATGS